MKRWQLFLQFWCLHHYVAFVTFMYRERERTRREDEEDDDEEDTKKQLLLRVNINKKIKEGYYARVPDPPRAIRKQRSYIAQFGQSVEAIGPVFDEKRMGTVRDTDRVVRERIEFDVQRSDGNMDVADEAMPADRESSRGRTENGKRESTRGDF